MQVTLGHRVIRVTVAGRQFDIGERGRLTGATTAALLMHLLVLWVLIANAPHPMDLPAPDAINAELYRVEPLPEPQPDQPQPQPSERVTPRQTPPEPVPQPAQQAQVQTPQPQTAASPQPVPAPQPAPVPDKSLQTAPRDTEAFQAVKPTTLSNRTDRALQNNDRSMPTVAADEPQRNPDATKKKKREEEVLDANPKLAQQHDVSDLKVHETPLPSVDAAPPAPSGLSPDASRQASAPPAGGQSGAAGARGSAGAAALGQLKGGRNGVTQALQNHESCVDIQKKGKTPPKDCDMLALGQMNGLGLKPDAHLQAAAAARDADLRYKTQPGNTDYWKRVNDGPQSRYQPDDTVKPGQYSNDKDDRTRNGTNNDPKARVSY
ncbi:hypothetical protein [Asticcacaulis solisilvae]|uniref:hypothetical protein n=1 Tax=Asticcacaulis solisilvae TaxID=1217274 RepID=UPI003FD6CC6E